jgi:RNA polymerase sigma-70 factor (ECF subfamily)
VQEVFIKLWQKRKELTIDFSLEAYLKRAVVNTSINHLDRKQRITSLDASQAKFVQASENTVDQQQSFNELSVRIDYAIGKLPQRTQLVFKLIRFEEMSYKEVSEGLEISLKAVEKEMMKALRLLREALKDYLPLLISSIFLAL